MGPTSVINDRRREFNCVLNMEGANIKDRPSSFVLSPDGEKAQKKIWSETMALLKQEAPEVDTSVAT
jgi:hypothetical protein